MKRSLALLALLGCAVPASPPQEIPTLPEDAAAAMKRIAAEYASSYRLAVSAEAQGAVFLLCKMPSTPANGPFHALEGQGANTKIAVYTNGPAWDPMHRSGDRVFPVGSVIVKDKATGGLGIMEKRQDGWRYGYVSADGQVHTDVVAVASCVACHEHGTVPESAQGKGFGIDLGQPRDAVFLTGS